jgi:hypothetical protein
VTFAEYAGIDGDELARLVETPRSSESIDLGTLAVLDAVG